MWRETDYLTSDILNMIDSKIVEIYNKYDDILQAEYIGKVYNDGELVYLRDIKNMEDSIEYLGYNFDYPDDWIETKNWEEGNSISYVDLNRMWHNLNILINGDFKPLVPKDNLYPCGEYKHPDLSLYPPILNIEGNILIPTCKGE